MDWDDAATELGLRGFQVVYVLGSAPVQAEGRLDHGEAFYFRSRHDTAELYVADCESPADFLAWSGWRWHGELSRWPDGMASFLDPSETVHVIDELVALYRAGLAGTPG